MLFVLGIYLTPKSNKSELPGQLISVLQDSVSKSPLIVELQSSPPYSGAGSVQVRSRVLVPLGPHVDVHVVQTPQVAQFPLTRSKIFIFTLQID